MEIDVRSEIGELTGVIIHTPGAEVENMTPENAERALYSDILNLSIAQREYAQLEQLLRTVTQAYQVRDLLVPVLEDPTRRRSLLRDICRGENCPELCDALAAQPSAVLAGHLIEGVLLPRDNLTRFLSKERFALPPLHNFFFTRDAAMAILDEIVIGRMAKPIRARESTIMAAIFDHHCRPGTVNPGAAAEPAVDAAATVEGGDVLVAREDILVIGNGSRTSSQGIDRIIDHFKARKEPHRHILVQELPSHPESFIHLDMVFTLLDPGHCLVFAPLLLKPTKYQTIHILMEDGRVAAIREEKGLLEALARLGMDLEPVYCGGRSDLWVQEREQWHSGANFFALAPGKVVGYARNVATMEEMSRCGFEIIPADDIITGRRRLADVARCAITLDGSELPRGGGGARCMTLPVSRRPCTD